MSFSVFSSTITLSPFSRLNVFNTLSDRPGEFEKNEKLEQPDCDEQLLQAELLVLR
jgi:copper oxidase (laccase) domain-containing protein